ncbi:MAG: glycosyltransferase [Gammaproteobacteria bacterium]|nr:glycosyltransferase [Gammaproteobacteria bacterium]
MPKILIVCPHFPPINGADGFRIRTSLRHYKEFGWEPEVLAVDVKSIEQDWCDRQLLNTIPNNTLIKRVRAWPFKVTRLFGIGAIGIRAFHAMNKAGQRIIKKSQPDLVFFSTTAFPLMGLGPIWKRKFGLPYVIDIHDPWCCDSVLPDAQSRRGIKHTAMRFIHKMIESRVALSADGLMAVAPEYIESLHRRYPVLGTRPSEAIIFGSSVEDLKIARNQGTSKGFIDRTDGMLHGVYVGAFSEGMVFAIKSLFLAFKLGLRENRSFFERMRFHFIGTSYGTNCEGNGRIKEIAIECGIEEFVDEEASRQPYFDAVKIQDEADFLILPGSVVNSFIASKLAGMLMAERPILGVCITNNTTISLLESLTGALYNNLDLATKEDADLVSNSIRILLEEISDLDCGNHLKKAEKMLAPDLTKQQCDLFNRVISSL